MKDIVITGSHEPVTDRADWSARTAIWLVEAAEHEIQILGICFGHQILAYAFNNESEISMVVFILLTISFDMVLCNML